MRNLLKLFALALLVCIAGECTCQSGQVQVCFAWDYQGVPVDFFELCILDTSNNNVLSVLGTTVNKLDTVIISTGFHRVGVRGVNAWGGGGFATLDTTYGIPSIPTGFHMYQLGLVQPIDTTQVGWRVDWIKDTSDFYKIYFGEVFLQKISTGQFVECWDRDCVLVEDNFAYVQLIDGRNWIGVTGIFDDPIEGMNYESAMSDIIEIIVN